MRFLHYRSLFLLLPLAATIGVCAGESPSGATTKSRADGEKTPGRATDGGAWRDPAYRPFSSDSPWNCAVGSRARFRTISSPGFDVRNGAGINATRWSHPVYIAKASDPLRDIFWRGETRPFATIRVPAEAQPDPKSDAHLHIIDPLHGMVVEMFEADVSRPDRIVATAVARNDLRGPGVYWRWHGARAYGGSAIGGLIRNGELTNGIGHALAIAVRRDAMNQNAPDGKPYVWPACAADRGWQSTYAQTGNLYMGSLLAIPPSVDLKTIGVGTSGPAYEIARALQNYGAYVTSATAVNLVLYAEPTAAGEIPPRIGTQLSQIALHLQVITNNAPGSVGGGGRTTLPQAPPLKGDGSLP